MSTFFKVLGRTFIVILVCFVAVAGLLISGAFEMPIFVDTTKSAPLVSTYTKTNTSNSNSSSGSSNSSSSNNSNTIVISTTNSSTGVNSIPSALTIKLEGKYLEAYTNATSNIPVSDTKSRILIKVGLQILQSGTITYEYALHYYSLNYTHSASEQKVKQYNLLDAINRINQKKTIYTDCFGYARLTHVIAAYTINPKDPGSVEGLGNMYGLKGGYADGKTYNNLSVLKNGAMLYDCVTGSGGGSRHVAIFLYAKGNSVTYMDQSGLHTGEFKGTYIYAVKGSAKPYNFNKYRNFV